ncbi:MAG: glycosyltransferase family 39 protein [Deltaproteobacteria bacterium]|nr:glycosyltransferase family 39 protein [Deltaproteobacteria bacterium]
MSLVERLAAPAAARRALLLITLAAVVVRLPYLTAPIADRHSWNQCSTATVIRNFATGGFDLLHPEWDVLDPGPPARNIEAEEAPIYSGVSAFLYVLFGASHAWPRLLSILAMAVGGFFLFRLAGRLFDPAAAVAAVFLWHFSPYPWYFGRTIMSDPWMLASGVAAADYFHRWLQDDRTRDLALAGLWTCLAGLFKAFALHIGVLFALALLARRGPRGVLDKRLLWFAALCLVLPVAWIAYAAKIGSLGNVLTKPGDAVVAAPHLWGDPALLLTPKFWLKIQSRVFDRAMTPLATALVVAAFWFADVRRKTHYPLFWLVAALVYVAIVRSGNYEHNYYQLPFVPGFVLIAGAGAAELVRRARTRLDPDRALIGGALAFLALSLVYVRAEYRQDLSSVRAAEIAAEVTRPDDLLLVLDPGATRKIRCSTTPAGAAGMSAVLTLKSWSSTGVGARTRLSCVCRTISAPWARTSSLICGRNTDG